MEGAAGSTCFRISSSSIGIEMYHIDLGKKESTSSMPRPPLVWIIIGIPIFVIIPIMEMMTNMGIPIMIQTRGGRGIDDVLSFLPKSMWYISIPILDDDIRKQVEPAAPSIESRFQLIDKLKAAGHEV